MIRIDIHTNKIKNKDQMDIEVIVVDEAMSPVTREMIDAGMPHSASGCQATRLDKHTAFKRASTSPTNSSRSSTSESKSTSPTPRRRSRSQKEADQQRQFHALQRQRSATTGSSYVVRKAGVRSGFRAVRGGVNTLRQTISLPAGLGQLSVIGTESPAGSLHEQVLAKMAFAEQQKWITVQQKTFTKW